MDHTRINRILKRPLVTEKMTILQDKKKRNGEPLNQYAFVVNTDANKMELKKAIELKFKVKVESIRTLTVKGKNVSRMTRAGLTKGRRSDWKKAIVTLAKDNKIEFVEGA